MKQEIELETYLLGEIVNTKSNDYLQTYYFTHKYIDGANELWYRAYTDYTVENTSGLWFKDGEVSWFEE